MDLRFTALLVCCAVGTCGFRVHRQVDILSEDDIDNISDSSDDIIFPFTRPRTSPGTNILVKEESREDGMNLPPVEEGDEEELSDTAETGDNRREGAEFYAPADSESEEEDGGIKHIAISDPKVYGMNIGLHFILEDINRRLIFGQRVHLESLIKVLVMTRKIEQVGGTLSDENKMALKTAVQLFPASLREAMEDD